MGTEIPNSQCQLSSMSAYSFDFFYFLGNSFMSLKEYLLCIILHFLIFWYFVMGEFLGCSVDHIFSNASPQRFFKKTSAWIPGWKKERKYSFFFYIFLTSMRQNWLKQWHLAMMNTSTWRNFLTKSTVPLLQQRRIMTSFIMIEFQTLKI